ncbi:MAG: hypothetical protein ABIU06_06370 [Anaerolineales bacterium]
MKLFIMLFPATFMLVACQTTSVSPLVAEQGVEFVLAPGVMATIKDTGLTIKLISVSSDGRCPSEVECTESGPVQLSLSAQKDNSMAAELMLQTFTDNEGRSPAMEFEGVTDRIVYEGYLIRFVGVLPYPEDLSTPIRQNDYRVSFVVTERQKS